MIQRLRSVCFPLGVTIFILKCCIFLLSNVKNANINSNAIISYFKNMSSKQPTEKEILSTVLKPLLEDFQYWFDRSSSLLKSENLPFLSADEQEDLLTRIEKAKLEVSTAQMLFDATDGEIGIESKMLVPWHRLVAKCWDVARRWREFKNVNYPSADM